MQRGCRSVAAALLVPLLLTEPHPLTTLKQSFKISFQEQALQNRLALAYPKSARQINSHLVETIFENFGNSWRGKSLKKGIFYLQDKITIAAALLEHDGNIPIINQIQPVLIGLNLLDQDKRHSVQLARSIDKLALKFKQQIVFHARDLAHQRALDWSSVKPSSVVKIAGEIGGWLHQTRTLAGEAAEEFADVTRSDETNPALINARRAARQLVVYIQAAQTFLPSVPADNPVPPIPAEWDADLANPLIPSTDIPMEIDAPDGLPSVSGSAPVAYVALKQIRDDAIEAMDKIRKNDYTVDGHHVPSSEFILRISVRKYREKDGRLFEHYRVINCGHLPSEVIKSLFRINYFRRAESFSKGGIGWNLLGRAIPDLGGMVSIHNLPGPIPTVQSDLYIDASLLPLVPADDVLKAVKARALSAARDPSESTDLHGEKSILLIDDEESLLGLEKAFLEMKGFHVETFESGLRALDALSASPEKYSLVIMDWGLKDIKGSDLISKSRALKPTLPIVVCSGYNDGTIDLSSYGGGIYFLAKPFNPFNVFIDKANEALQWNVPSHDLPENRHRMRISA